MNIFPDAVANQSVNESGVIHHPVESVSDWQLALQYLKEGNQRYLNNRTIQRNTNEEDRKALTEGQKPFAVIVTCSDSRVSPEIYFDQKLGDLFVIRNAGNIADQTTMGSIEYAVEHLGAPLVVIVGHSKCGAVTTVYNEEPGAQNSGGYPANLSTILDSIRPAIAHADSIDKAIQKNTVSVTGKVRSNDIVVHMGAKVIGALYDIETGRVDWIF